MGTKRYIRTGGRCKCEHKGNKGIPIIHSTSVKERLRKKIAERNKEVVIIMKVNSPSK